MNRNSEPSANKSKTTDQSTSVPLRVGIWLPLPSGLHWSGEGIGRTIEFVLEGFKTSGLLDQKVRFIVVCSSWMRNEIENSFLKLLGTVDAFEFVEIRTNKHRMVKLVDLLFSAGASRQTDSLWIQEFDSSFFSDSVSDADLRKYLALRRDIKAAETLGTTKLLDEIAVQLGLEPLKLPRIKSVPWWNVSARIANGEVLRSVSQRKKKLWTPIRRKLEEESGVHTAPAGLKSALELARALTKLRFFGRYFSFLLNRMRGQFNRGETFEFARFATRIDGELDVDVWWVPTPNIEGPEFLKKPVVANFWDFVIGEYGWFWDQGSLTAIYSRVKLVMHRADLILTQSHHNRGAKLIDGFSVPDDKVNVCYLTAPLFYRDFVPSFAATGVKTYETRKEAELIIHNYLKRRLYVNFRKRPAGWASRGLELERLLHFEFSKTTFAICSTQNRPYKNVPFLVDTYLRLIRKRGLNSYLFLTTEFDLSNKDDEIGQIIRKRKMVGRVFSLSRVPNEVHAALYHCAACTLHPSFTEGGIGSYPFLEGMVMGTPGLVAAGEYSYEGRRLHPDYDRIMMSPLDKKAAAKKIEQILADPARAYVEQLPIFEAHAHWTWGDVASFYYASMCEAAQRPDPSIVDNLKAVDKSRYFSEASERVLGLADGMYSGQRFAVDFTNDDDSA